MNHCSRCLSEVFVDNGEYLCLVCEDMDDEEAQELHRENERDLGEEPLRWELGDD